MNGPPKEKVGWKQKLSHEMLQYWINVVYLAAFFGIFTWYRRLILAEYHITYFHYWVAIIEALILAKVVLVGSALHLDHRFEEKALVISILYKTFLFSVYVAAFAVLEQIIEGLIHGKGLAAGIHKIMHESRDELLARCLLTFFAFIPFFAFKELGRVLGHGKLSTMFFSRH
jgi:hypothetical protein